MTCVSCSSAIEKGLTSAFKNRGLLVDSNKEHSGVHVILLMHKMRISFYKDIMEESGVNQQSIIDEVEDIGFGATLINKFELIEEVDFHLNQSSTTLKIQSQVKTSFFVIKGMTCSSCSNSVEKHLLDQDGIISVSVSLVTHKAVI